VLEKVLSVHVCVMLVLVLLLLLLLGMVTVGSNKPR
jgi:hypothetical protein